MNQTTVQFRNLLIRNIKDLSYHLKFLAENLLDVTKLFREDIEIRTLLTNQLVYELLTETDDRTYDSLSRFGHSFIDSLVYEKESVEVRVEYRRILEALYMRMFNIACDLTEESNIVGLTRLSSSRQEQELYFILSRSEVMMERLARCYKNTALFSANDADLEFVSCLAKILVEIGKQGILSAEVFTYNDGIVTHFKETHGQRVIQEGSTAKRIATVYNEFFTIHESRRKIYSEASM